MTAASLKAAAGKAEWYNETLYEHYGQRYEITKMLFEAKTDHQHLVIFENPALGRVMALDGVIQVTTGDEFVYHEMLTHLPILAHGGVENVLIIGGGDGGILREVLKHKGVKKATMVEIDGSVVEMSKKWLPSISNGAFDDPRLNLVIDDGMNFIRTCQDKFDVIISDSTDPMGPGEVLFTTEFYSNCARCLTPRGVLVTQNGVPFFQRDELKTTRSRLKPLFKDAGFYVAAIPTYIGGFMSLAWATQEESLRNTPLETLKERFAASGITTQYYNPGIHQAAFALPQFIWDAIKN